MMIDADPRPVGAAAAGPAARSWCSTAKASARWRARARSAGCPTSRRWASPRCCGSGRPTPARCGSAITVRRDPGTPEVEPRYDNGRTVRFSQANDARRDRRGHRAAVGGHPGAVPAAFLGSDRVVVAGSAVHPAGLARRTAGPRPHGVDALVSDRDVLAGRRRHDERGVGAGRARAQLRRLRARRLGGRRAARRLDRRGHRTDPAGAGRRPSRPTDPSTSARQPIRAAALARGAGRVEPGDAADPARWHPVPHAVFGTALAVRPPGRRWVCGRPRCGRACGWGWRWPRRWLLGVAAATAIPPVRDGDGRARRCPRRRALAAAAHPAGHGVGGGGGLPGGAGHRRRTRRSGRRAGGCSQSATFGLSHIADARATGEPVLGTVRGHRRGGLDVRLAL